jgi:hypothetical protein
MISSHLNGFKSAFFNDIQKSFPIDLAGGPHGKVNSKFVFLQDYLYSLCPENFIYPGYYTEKVLEAYACGTLPITCLDKHAECDFNTQSYINLYRYIPSGLGNALREVVSDKGLIRSLYQQPLFLTEPSIIPLLSLLEDVVSTANKRSPCWV